MSQHRVQCRHASLQIDRLQVLLQSRLIIACKCNPKVARSQPQRASPNPIDHHFQVPLLSSLEHGPEVHLQTRSITAPKGFSRPARSRPLSSHDHDLQLHLQTRSILASMCISEFTRSQFQVYLQTRPITASKYIVNVRRWVYRDTLVMEADRVMRSIYLVDPGVDRHHLISICSDHRMIIHGLSFPTFGHTRSVRDFLDTCKCVDPNGRVVSYLLTFLHTSSLMLKELEE